jgi:tripeptidyl-peptidase-1
MTALTGKNPLGFLNPLLYQLKEGVGKDILEGNNVSGECPKGFNAVEGWDAVTGLGTPNFPILMKQLVEI